MASLSFFFFFFFPFVLNSLTASTNKKKTREWVNKKKKELVYKAQNILTSQQLTTNTTNLSDTFIQYMITDINMKLNQRSLSRVIL